ncbi:MAG: zinc metallopeptidase [Anaerolineaceae bacterium]|nr:zinc metallopeptidase [Anaerolineaceae bacterium]
MGFPVFNFEYLIFTIPALIFSLIAQAYVKSAYKKWGNVRNYLNITGAEAAQRLALNLGLRDMTVQGTSGTLSDHYDPRNNVLKLSPAVANNPSVASLAIAAHELGHAQQDKDKYLPLQLRSAIVPLVSIGSNLGWIMLLAGLMLQLSGLAWVGLIAFSAGAIFSLVTLPVELNASKRAIAMLKDNGLVVRADEEQGVRAVLRAAALTYVAALASSLLQLLYFGSRVNRMRRR